MPIDPEAFERTRRSAVRLLLAERVEGGWWEGELSSSALSTATAVAALALVDGARGTSEHRDLIERGLGWLIGQQNADGGWGDTDRSFSNISTTMLCWAALNLRRRGGGEADRSLEEAAERRAERWLVERAGSLEPAALAEAVMRRYGKDRTFSVPILTMCALCGRPRPRRQDFRGQDFRGRGQDFRGSWRWVRQLPFELAALPQGWFRWLNLEVVSYALPALIAIGLVRHVRRPTRNPLARLVRAAVKGRVLRVLERIQPPNGGFLEATPLTSFVTMSLAGAGLADHPVAQRGVKFLVASAREDGSWPIDTNLATWVTTLSVNALAAGGRLSAYLDADERRKIVGWLLGQQHTRVHPYTNAAPGGWAWTDLPGGVPDADDTSGAVLALANLSAIGTESAADARRIRDAAEAGLRWLGGLQNRDGGIPTFCRGWGKLPFDRSSCDITAHAIRAMTACPNQGATAVAGRSPAPRIGRGADRSFRALRFLVERQQSDGGWPPLWFGNQHSEDESNPTYGTSRVVSALAMNPPPEGPQPMKAASLEEEATPGPDPARDAAAAAARWLLAHQNADGGWGGGGGTPSSIEETALAVEALAAVRESFEPASGELGEAIERGAAWLIRRTEEGELFEPSPIGFYFAKLWYYEKLYPLIFTVAALERVARWVEGERGRPRGSADRRGSEGLA